MNFEKLDEFLAGQEGRGIPSCDMTVCLDGRVVYRSIRGHVDLERTRPASDRDMYYLYSVSKVATCVGALRALERGLISLDDPVAKYLPAFAYVRVKRADGSITPAENTMTVRHLFTMTGGLNYDLWSPPIQAARETGKLDTVSVANAIAEVPLSFEPGTSYEYSLCHDVLAAVVEVAAGVRFAEYQQKEIFTPLGMIDTTYHMNEEQRSRLVTLYRYDDATFTPTPCEQNNIYILGPDYDSGGAGLTSTASSYTPLIAALSNGGTSVEGYELLRPETIKLLQENQLCHDALKVFGAGRFSGYGFGLCCRTHMRPDISLSPSSVGEFGWDSAGNSYVMIDPARRIGIVYLAHMLGCITGYHIHHPALRRLVYEALEQ